MLKCWDRSLHPLHDINNQSWLTHIWSKLRTIWRQKVCKTARRKCRGEFTSCRLWWTCSQIHPAVDKSMVSAWCHVHATGQNLTGGNKENEEAVGTWIKGMFWELPSLVTFLIGATLAFWEWTEFFSTHESKKNQHELKKENEKLFHLGSYKTFWNE